MVVRGRNGIRMIIVQPGYKRTNHKGIGLKGLVYGRWLVYAAGYGFKIVNRKDIGIAASVPPYYVKRMCAIM